MIKILTERRYNKGISRQVVYEWEDDISSRWNIPFAYMDSYKKHPISRMMRKLHIRKSMVWNSNEDCFIFFAMNIDLLRIVAWSTPNILPVLLDVTLDEVEELYDLTKNLPIFWVTAIKIKEVLLNRHPDCKVCYIPQMASDKHLHESFDKKISLIQFGRRNPVLHEFAQKYVDTHKGTSYLYRCDNPADGMEQRRNGISERIGVIGEREKFNQLLQQSTICLCSTPLIDNTRNFGEGVDFLTARWYEAIMSRCFIIARASKIVMPELEATGLAPLIANIASYDIFESECNKCLADKILPLEIAAKFAEKNSAAHRGGVILASLHERGIDR